MKCGCAVWHTFGPGRQNTQALPRGIRRELNLPNHRLRSRELSRAPWLQVGKPSLFTVGVRMECPVPRESLPLVVDDLSSVAKALRAQLLKHELPQPPGHQTLLNMLARAAGHRNLQTLMARPPAPPPKAPPPAAGLSDIVRRTLNLFDDQGRLQRLPAKRSLQLLSLWGLWMRFDAKRPYREREVNQILTAWHSFGDYCTLRRDLVTQGLMARTADSSVYTKLPARPGEDPRALMRALRQLGQLGSQPAAQAVEEGQS